MKAVRINNEAEYAFHVAQGHAIEYSAKSNHNAIDMPPYYEPASGGWIEDGGDGYIMPSSIDYRAWIPDDVDEYPRDSIYENIAAITVAYGIVVEYDTTSGIVTFYPNEEK